MVFWVSWLPYYLHGDGLYSFALLSACADLDMGSSPLTNPHMGLLILV